MDSCHHTVLLALLRIRTLLRYQADRLQKMFKVTWKYIFEIKIYKIYELKQTKIFVFSNGRFRFGTTPSEIAYAYIWFAYGIIPSPHEGYTTICVHSSIRLICRVNDVRVDHSVQPGCYRRTFQNETAQ